MEKEVRELIFETIHSQLASKITDRLLVGVSGGVDSMVLAHTLYELKYQFEIAHCNFKLRGIDSDADQSFVEDWARERKIQVHVGLFPIDLNSASIQEKAREFRLKYFRDIMQEYHLNWLVTAHHSNDLLETFLMRLAEGAGPKGLAVFSDIHQISLKPFKHLSKIDILNFATLYNLPYRTDSSNAKSDYRRNKIRNILIPEFIQIYPNFQRGAARSMVFISETYEYFYKQFKEWECKNIVEKQDRWIISGQMIQNQLHLKEFLSLHSFGSKAIGQILLNLDTPGKKFISKDKKLLVIAKNSLILYKKIESDPSKINIALALHQDVVFNQFKFTCLKTSSKDEIYKFAIPNKNMLVIPVEWFQENLSIRLFQNGDCIQSFGMKSGKKKLKKIFAENGVDIIQRRNWPLLEKNGSIIWVPGLVKSEQIRLSDKNINLVLISFSME